MKKRNERMSFNDIREFIAELEKQGEAVRIKEEVDWNLEAGAMIRRSNEKGLPSPFFENVKGYPGSWSDWGNHIDTLVETNPT